MLPPQKLCVCLYVCIGGNMGGGGICAMLDDYVLCVDAIIFPDSRASGRTGARLWWALCVRQTVCAFAVHKAQHTHTHTPTPETPFGPSRRCLCTTDPNRVWIFAASRCRNAIAFDTILAWNKCVFFLCLSGLASPLSHPLSPQLSLPRSRFPSRVLRSNVCVCVCVGCGK